MGGLNKKSSLHFEKEGAGCFFASAAKGHRQKAKPLVGQQGV